MGKHEGKKPRKIDLDKLSKIAAIVSTAIAIINLIMDIFRS